MQNVLIYFMIVQQILILSTVVNLACCEVTLTIEQAWIYGTLVGVGISLMGFAAALLLVCVQRCLSEDSFKTFVNMLYALGCGAIIGDAMIHILPQAYGNDENDSHIVSLVFICAVVFFIVIERVFESCGIVHHHWGEDQHHHHHQAQFQCEEHPQQEQFEKKAIQSNQENQNKNDSHLNNGNAVTKDATQKQVDKEKEFIQGKKEHHWLDEYKGKGAAGYLNLISSFIHNFFDGFAVGVGFASRDPKIFVPVVVAILAHEIPRQMGDVGILMKNGFSNIQTVVCNGVINFMSLAGLFPGLALGGISNSTQNYVMTFVAGNFIYIGADIWRNLLRNNSKTQNAVQLLLFSCGVGAMYLVLFAEQD